MRARPRSMLHVPWPQPLTRQMAIVPPVRHLLRAKDLADLPDNVKNALEIVPVSRMDEVLAHALVRQPTPITWEEEHPAKAAPANSGDETCVVAH